MNGLMNFVIEFIDAPGSLEKRIRLRPRHVEYVSSFSEHVLAAGPLLAPDEETPIGNLMIVRFPNESSATAFARGDPFVAGGVFESISVRNWRKVIFRDSSV